METIRGLPEAVEQKDDFAGSIVARDEALASYAQSPGLGPPDLCWLQKASKGGVFSTTSSEPRGFFHYCLGRDVSSSAAIAAYFAELNAKVDPIGMMQGLWYTSETVIQRGFYCCYDPFSRLDIRCELCIPGGVVCGALDSDGTVHEVTQDMWRNCAVASFLRHQLMDPDLTAHAPILHRWQPVPGSDAERRLLDAVYEMYDTGLLPRDLDFVTADSARGCVAEHMDLVLYTVYQYFGARHRWHAALDFFQRLHKIYTNAAVFVAAVQRELDSFDDSFATLSAAVEASPQEPSVLLALANECMYADQLDMAAKLARRAVRLHRELRPAWLLLARCYIRQGLYSLALVTLNVAPPPPMPQPEQEILFYMPPPEPKYLTKPSSVRYDPDLAAAKQMNNEEVTADGSRGLLYLPAAVMVPHEPLDLGAWPDLGPARVTRAVLSAAYGLLQELVAAIGWDNFLEMRARVFVMQSEASTKYSSTEAAQGDVVPVDSPEAAPLEVQGTTYYDKALEELAAMGLNEHPQEVQAARAANAAVAVAAAEEGTGAADTTQPAAVSTQTANGDAAATAPTSSAAQSDSPTAKRGSGDAVAHVADSGSPSLVSRQDKLPQDADSLTAVSSLPTAASAMTSIWSMMFGAPKSSSGRSEMSESQVAKLQQYGSVVPPKQPQPPTTDSRAPQGPGPIAEATTHYLHSGNTMVQHRGGSEQHAGPTNPWQASTGSPPWLCDVGSSHAHGRRDAGAARRLLGALVRLRQRLADRRSQQRAGIAAERERDGPRHAGPVCEAREGGGMVDYYSDSDNDSEDLSEEELGQDDVEEGGRSRDNSTGLTTQYSAGPLSNVAADREFVLLGSAAPAEDEQQAKAKRLCVRWLDELIIALWHDLQAYMEWKAQDAELQRVVGNTLAGLVLDVVPAQAPGDPADPESGTLRPRPSQVPQLPPGDWMRRGLLAERLYHDAEALSAYRACLALGPFNLIAGQAVMRLAAEAAETRLALQACLQVLSWHTSQLVAGAASAFPPTAVVCCVGHVASLLSTGDLQELVDQVLQQDAGSSPEAAKSWLRQIVTGHSLMA